jgi:hypothetical protein
MSRVGETQHEETFRPRVAPFMAVAWYTIAAFAAWDLVRRGDGRAVPIGLASLALVTIIVYAIAQRPAVVANSRGVLLRNVVRDVWLPWYLVKAIETKWSLTFHTEDATYGSWALTGGSANRPRAGSLAAARVPSPAQQHQVTWNVPDRLEQLRRRGLHGERTGGVEVRTVWPLLAVLGLTVAVLVVLLAVPMD